MPVDLFRSSPQELDSLLSTRAVTVAVVGFGYIGTVIGAVLADRGWQVSGIDVRPEVVDEINEGRTRVREPGLPEVVARTVADGRLRATTDFAAVAEHEIVVVTVGTPLGPDYEPVVDDIVAAARGVAAHLRPGHLVVLKSTVPPHTTERLVRPILEETGLRAGVDFGLAFCPERLAEGKAMAELVSIPVVVGATDPQSAAVCSALWHHALGVESIVVDDPTTAEMTKLADNWWIDLNIAVANELAMICDRLGIDALQVIAAANSLPKVDHHVNILRPSMGVGGYCLTKDPWFVAHLGASLGLSLVTPQSGRTANDRMPEYTFELVRAQLEAAGRRLEDSTVAVLGISFKNNTGDTRLTPTRTTVALLANTGAELRIHDPWVTTEEARTVTAQPLVDDFEKAVTGAHALVFLTGHQEFLRYPLAELATLVEPGCVFLDGRNAFDPAAVRAAGFRYKGIGR